MSYVAVDLGLLGSGHVSVAYDTTNGGTLVVGAATDSSNHRQAVYWDAAHAIHQLPSLTANTAGSQANGVSGNGGVIVGYSTNLSGYAQPVAWASPSYSAAVPLQLFNGQTGGEAFACSQSGLVVV